MGWACSQWSTQFIVLFKSERNESRQMREAKLQIFLTEKGTEGQVALKRVDVRGPSSANNVLASFSSIFCSLFFAPQKKQKERNLKSRGTQRRIERSARFSFEISGFISRIQFVWGYWIIWEFHINRFEWIVDYVLSFRLFYGFWSPIYVCLVYIKETRWWVEECNRNDRFWYRALASRVVDCV